MLFNDTITIYTHTIKQQTINGVKTDVESWERKVVEGVQWSDHNEKTNEGGKISLAKYANITFPEGTYEGLTLDASREEDAIFYGVISETVTTQKGSRLSDLMNKHEKSGRIKSVNDNSNRQCLKNIKVVVA